MGLVYADIKLINGDDVVLARRNIIGQEEVKEMYVSMLVDTGSYNLRTPDLSQFSIRDFLNHFV